jgi:hypothetical protein
MMTQGSYPHFLIARVFVSSMIITMTADSKTSTLHREIDFAQFAKTQKS